MTKQLLPVLLLLFSIQLPAEQVGRPLELSDYTRNGEQFMQIRLLGALELRGNPALEELSALAWDEDEQFLYGISDRGVLLHLTPRFEDDLLTGLEMQAHYILRDAQGRPLSGHWRDSEGLVLEHANDGKAGNSRLLISFERRHRVVRYTAQGHFLEQIPLPQRLAEPGFYRNLNRGLEALTLHPYLGLLTGPEQMRDDAPIPIFDRDENSWFYQPVEPEGSLVAMEALDDGSLIILERAMNHPLIPWVISLSRSHPRRSNSGQKLSTQLLARFDSSQGWRVHNFEGLARHRGNRFFMVSDNGGFPLLQTQLLYFEILDSSD